MTFPIPGLLEIIKRGESDYKFETGSDASALQGRYERALVKSQAGHASLMYQHVAWGVRQFFVRFADDEGMLVSKAASFGVDRKPASRAEGTIQMNGTGGTVVPKGFRFIRADGEPFEMIAEQTIVLGFEFNLRAVNPGAAGNTEAGIEFFAQEPLTGLSAAAPVIQKFKGGLDAEGIEDLRSRLLFRLANPPGGGTLADYKRWAWEVPGVTRVWTYDMHPKIGDVYVLFTRDGDGANDLIFPNAAQIASVQEYRDAKAPGGLPGPTVAAPIPKVLAMSLALMPDNATNRTAVEDAVRDMLYQRAKPPVEAGTSFSRTWIAEAISGAPGEEEHSLTVPAGDIALAPYELLYLNLDSDPVVWL